MWLNDMIISLIGYKPLTQSNIINKIMKTIEKGYYNSLNKAINAKVEIEFYSCVKRLSVMREISLKRAYWVLLSEF